MIDYLIRQRVTAHLSFFFIYNLPVPRLTEGDAAFAPIVERAARLICTTPEFDELARSVGLRGHNDGVTDEAARARLRAELDGLVAHLYGLTEDEFAYILTTFPLVAQPVKDAALNAYLSYAPDPTDEALARLLQQGESNRLELKVAARWNPFTQKKDDTMKENVVQAVAAFLNSAEGGALVLGVAPDGQVVGLQEDFKAADAKKANRDGYELFLRNVLGHQLGGEFTLHYDITFHALGGAEVCRIAVRPAAKPAYVNGDLYVRDGNQKRKLSAQEATAYVRQRWSHKAVGHR